MDSFLVPEAQLLPRKKKIIFLNGEINVNKTCIFARDIHELIKKLNMHHSKDPVYVCNFMTTSRALSEWLSNTCGIYQKLHVVDIGKNITEKLFSKLKTIDVLYEVRQRV